MKPTAKQVAHAAGVSLSAVSRAFSPGSPLDEGKRRRVLVAATQLGYKSPSRRTADAIMASTVALVAADLANPFYPLVLETLARQLQARGLQLVVYAAPEQSEIDALTNQVLAARPLGVIATSAWLSSSMANSCRQHGIRVVLLNRIQRDVRTNSVACDNYGGGRDVAQYLLARGYRKIGFISGIASTSTNVDRARGFKEFLVEAGSGLFVEAEGAFNYKVSRQAASWVLAKGEIPDALFCCNDLMALAAIDAARERGIKIPDDLAVVGFDDIPMASWNTFRLTTVRQPIERMAREAVDIIVNTDFQSDEGVTRIFPGRLIIRGSA